MIAIPSKNFAFIHVPKTAGTSIRNKLKEIETTPVIDGFMEIINRIEVGRGDTTERTINGQPYFRHGLHMGREELENLLPAFNATHTFAVVRNPYDRLVSAFFHDIRDRIRPGGRKELEDPNLFNFETWLRESHEENAVFTRPMTHWVDVEKDVIIQYENLNNELYKMEDVLGYRLELGHARMGLQRWFLKEHHNDIIRPQIKDFITEHYAEEIELFNYGHMS